MLKYVFLIPVLLASVGCAGIVNPFANKESKISESMPIKSENKNAQVDKEIVVNSGNEIPDIKKDNFPLKVVTGTSLLWKNIIGSEIIEKFSTREIVDDVLALSLAIGKNKDVITTLSPASNKGEVYAAYTNGQLACFDSVTGSQLWSINTQHKLSGGVGISEEMLLVGTFKGEILAYDKKGKFLWEASVPSEVLSQPQVDRNIVVVRTTDNKIYALDATSGKRMWIYQGPSLPLTVRSSAGVLVIGGGVFAGFSGGKLVAINLSNGGLVWEASVSKPRGVTELERMVDITSLPVIDNRQICAVAYRGRVACFDIANGNNIWGRDISSSAGLAMDSKHVYVSDDDGSVVAYNKESGTKIWKKDIPKVEPPKNFGITWITTGGDRVGKVDPFGGKDKKMTSSFWSFFTGNSDSETADTDKKKDKKKDKSRNTRPDLRAGNSIIGDFFTTTLDSSSKNSIRNKLSAPLVHDVQVVVGDSQGNVTFLKNEDGTIISQFVTDGAPILARPEYLSNGILVQTIKGGLYAFGM
ncbi:hypothetical protein LBMAG32_01210 [Nitrosomonadaceae bacterium]|nr:hypothetical protein LBMAG32_01210 [Nitrosomonadaceae bacterium]